uniref:Pyruvate kinase n=1 Tax=Lygus hesperus TaxID=30085 RepID=A0A0A9WE97_LYGHE
MIYIDDGLLKLQVEDINLNSQSVTTIIQNDAVISSQKGVNLPGTAVDLPSLSEKDKKDLRWGVAHHVDFIFASFIRSGEAIREIREQLGAAANRIQIISKIENQQGIENIDSIIQESDGVMVARGDLGIEIPVEKVFIAQKMIIAKCNILGKPVICATQMLESMTTNPRPTRAEVSDVANAVLDGADCVMLSGETAKGVYPVETVKMMHTICKEAEAAVPNHQHYTSMLDIHPISYLSSETLAGSAVNAAFTQHLKAIIVYSVSGRTARLASKYHPNCPIICVTNNPSVACSS